MKAKLTIERGARQPWYHVHFFKLVFATFEHHYETCRCGSRRARKVGQGGLMPSWLEWLDGK